MSDPNYDRLLESALTLAPNLRAMLAEQLLASLDTATQSEVDAAWAEEAERRLQEIQTGEVAAVPGEDVAKLLREGDRDEGQSKSIEDENAARDFLLSLAGTFNSGVSDTSENVKSLVAEAIAEKHQ